MGSNKSTAAVEQYIQTARLVTQLIQTATEEVFIWGLGPQHCVNYVQPHRLEALL